jgi:ADP-heptose:LPS heptosyltransferase/thiamine kinase-like enzyme
MAKQILLTSIGALEHIGDNVMKLSMLEPISKNFPGITIVVCCKYPEVFKHHPLVSKVIDGSKILSKEDARRILKKQKFEMIIETSIFGHQHFYTAASEMGLPVILSTHQQFRDRLRKIFEVPPPPYTDGEIPIVLSKIDEFVFSLKVNGLKVDKRYFPQLIAPPQKIKSIADRLIKQGFDYRKDTFILCENASDPAREWGVENFAKLAALLDKNNSQLIITSTVKNKNLGPYLKLGIDKHSLFTLDMTLGEFFALLSINKHFKLNVIKGLVCGDTGALHAACAVNNTLPYDHQMVILCLGHDETSGDIRYSQPGSIYVTRLKPKWDNRLERLAEQKLNMCWHSSIKQFLGLPYELINIDRPKKISYLVQSISSDQSKMPIFTGRQIYTHTLLRNILRNNEPFGAKGPLYRRMNVKAIRPKVVYRILEAELSKKYHCPLETYRSEKISRLETTFIAQELLKNKLFVPKVRYFYQWPKPQLENVRFPGMRLSEIWNHLSPTDKRTKLRELMRLLRSMHQLKSDKFGKFGLYNDWSFNSWPAYFKAVFKKKLQSAVRKKVLDKEEINSIKRFIRKNISYLWSKGAYLVHHDIKLDNIIIDGTNMRLIDFEYATSAPIDYELDTLLREFSNPGMYAHHNSLKKDLIIIKKAVLDFYPELIRFPHLNERLSLYSLKFYLDMLILGKHKEESKKRIHEILDRKIYFDR